MGALPQTRLKSGQILPLRNLDTSGGDWGTFTVPTGAPQLQFGVNDNEYSDNSGSWNIQITEVAVPEPSSLLLLGLGLSVLVFSHRRR